MHPMDSAVMYITVREIEKNERGRLCVMSKRTPFFLSSFNLDRFLRERAIMTVQKKFQIKAFVRVPSMSFLLSSLA